MVVKNTSSYTAGLPSLFGPPGLAVTWLLIVSFITAVAPGSNLPAQQGVPG